MPEEEINADVNLEELDEELSAEELADVAGGAMRRAPGVYGQGQSQMEYLDRDGQVLPVKRQGIGTINNF